MIEQRCSCRCGHADSMTESGNQNQTENQYVEIDICTISPTDLPPTYDQTEQKNLPTYDEASRHPPIKNTS